MGDDPLASKAGPPCHTGQDRATVSGSMTVRRGPRGADSGGPNRGIKIDTKGRNGLFPNGAPLPRVHPEPGAAAKNTDSAVRDLVRTDLSNPVTTVVHLPIQLLQPSSVSVGRVDLSAKLSQCVLEVPILGASGFKEPSITFGLDCVASQLQGAPMARLSNLHGRPMTLPCLRQGRAHLPPSYEHTDRNACKGENCSNASEGHGGNDVLQIALAGPIQVLAGHSLAPVRRGDGQDAAERSARGRRLGASSVPVT